MEASANFRGFLQQLSDEQLDELFDQTAAEELARHDANKSARLGAQAAFPSKV